MFEPAVGFVFFEFEFCDGFNGVTFGHDFEVVTGEFVREVSARVKVRLHSWSKRALMASRALVRRESNSTLNSSRARRVFKVGRVVSMEIGDGRWEVSDQ